MDCLILAGGEVKPEDALYPYTQGKPKALIDMGGRNMLDRVISAVSSSKFIDNILVVGINRQTAAEHFINTSDSLHFLDDQGGMVANMLAGAAWFRKFRPATEVVLGCSADIPTITGAIVDEFIEACRPWDKAVYYSFVRREILEARFPDSKRTYSNIGGQEVAGGDMVVARLEVVEKNQPLIESLTSARKRPWQIARVVGWRMLFKFLFQRITFDDIESTASRIIGMPAQVVLFNHAELAMDADKPFQIDMLQAEFT